jgi:hypothetical protein
MLPGTGGVPPQEQPPLGALDGVVVGGHAADAHGGVLLAVSAVHRGEAPALNAQVAKGTSLDGQDDGLGQGTRAAGSGMAVSRIRQTGAVQHRPQSYVQARQILGPAE